jgi:hypothetical protein
MFNDDRIVNLPGLTLMLLAGLVASAVWSSIGPPLYGVLAALVQTGVTTRLVLLCLFFSCGVALFALRTLKQVWYGRIACVGALAACWQLLGSLAVQMQPVDVLALVGAGYILVRGLVNIGPGSDGGTGSDRGQTGVRPLEF